MKNPKTQPTFLVRRGNRIKEYTPGHIVRKLQSGDLSPDHLAHNRDGMWRPLHETPGFRRICKATVLERPQPFRTKTYPVLPVNVPMAQPEEGIPAGVDTIQSMENRALDILNEEILPNTQNPPEGTDVSNSDFLEKPNAMAASPIPKTSVSSEGDEPGKVKALTNPYANRHYFRVRKADLVEQNPKPTTNLAEVFLSPKGKMIAAGVVGLAGLYFSSQFFLGGKKSGKPVVSGQQLSLLVNPDQEKSFLAQGHGRGVTERDKKFMESFRKSYMENLKHQ